MFGIRPLFLVLCTDTGNSGGGKAINLNLNQFGPSLRWMSYEAIRCGLKMIPYRGEWRRLKPSSSMTGLWKIVELMPIKRLTYRDAESVERL
jgi:hypothetical protein